MADRTIPALKILRGNIGVGTTLPGSLFNVYVASQRQLDFYGGTSPSGNNYVAALKLGRGKASNSAFEIKYDSEGTEHAYISRLYSSAVLHFDKAGTDQMTILADGKVGIGTNVPAVELHINDASGLSAIRLTGGAASADGFQIMQGVTGVTNAGFSIYDVDATATRLVIDTNGNVGIGTDAPPYPLSIKKGSSAIAFSEYSNGAVIWLDGANGDFAGGDYFQILADDAALRFGYAAVTKVSMLLNGSVGIGTAAPAFPFQVYGTSQTNGAAKRVVSILDSTSAAAGTGAGIALGGYIDGTSNAINDFGVIQGIKENGTAANYASAMLFSTRANGANPTERMRIDSSGNIVQAGGKYEWYDGSGAKVGEISTIGGNNLTISGTQTNHCGLSFATNAILPATQSATNNNIVDLGQNGNSFKDFYLSGKQYFDGVSSSYIDNVSHDLQIRGAGGVSLWTHTGGSWVEQVTVADGGSVGIGTDNPVTLLDVRGAVTVGVDDTGHDVRLYGATSGRYWEWDESQDLVRHRNNVKATWGDGDDLQLFHDGTNSYIQNGANGGHLSISLNGGLEYSALFLKDDAVKLFFNGVQQCETLSNGLKINNPANNIGYLFGGDGEILAGQDSSAYYYATGSGQNVSKPLFIGSNPTYIRLNVGGTERFRVTTSGASVTGNFTIPQGNLLYLDGGSNTYIYSDTADSISYVTNSGIRLITNNSGLTIPSNNNLSLGNGGNNAGLFRFYNNNSTAYYLDWKSTGARSYEFEGSSSSSDYVTSFSNAGAGGHNFNIEGMLRVKDKAGSANKFTVSDSGVVQWGSSAAHGTLTWDTDRALIGGIGTNNLSLIAEGTEVVNSTSSTWDFKKEARFPNNTGLYWLHADGSATAGIKLDTSDHLDFRTGGANSRMTLDDNGNLGIGTSAPARSLDVDGRVLADTYGFRSDTALRYYYFDNYSGSNFMGRGGNAFTSLYDGGVKSMVWKAGSVGIGVDAPTSLLHVTGDLGNSAFLAYFYNSGTQSEDNGLNVQIASSGSSAQALRVNTGGDSNAFIVAGDGDVGVGFTPSSFTHKFNVNGTAYISGSLKIGAFTLPNTDGSNGQVLQTNGSGTVTWATAGGGGGITGSGTTHYIPKFTASGAIGDSTVRQRAAGGNFTGFGIDPSYPVHSAGIICAEDGAGTVRLIGTAGSGKIIDLKSDGGIFKIRNTSSGNEMYHIQTGSSGYHKWYVNDSEKMRVDSNGNVGVGTGNPASRLQVYDATDITPTANGAGQFAVSGNGYTSFLAMNGTAAYFGHNSSGRSLVLMTNETDRLTISGSGAVTVAGSFSASSKSFLIDHPTKENKKLEYGCLEGPEFGVYHRGRAQSTTISLPDYWTGLVREETITVQLTPKGSFQHLYVVSQSLTEIVIGAADGETIDCFYTIYGERADIDRLEVEKEV